MNGLAIVAMVMAAWGASNSTSALADDALTTYRLPFKQFAPPGPGRHPTRRSSEAPRTLRAQRPAGNFQVFEVQSFRMSAKGEGLAWRSSGTQRIDFLRDSGAPPRSSNECMQRVLGGMLFGQMDEQALGHMVDDGTLYPAQKEQYRNRSGEQHWAQTRYYETVSDHLAAEIQALFGGKIPWEKVAEVHGPAGLTPEALRDLTEAGDPRITVRLRRTTLRLASADLWSQASDWFGNGVMSSLPWQENAALRAQHRWDRHREPIAFELGRASQMKFSEPEELVGLVRQAVIEAIEQVTDRDRLGLGAIVNARELFIPVYIHSDDVFHTRLYRRMYGGEVVASAEYTVPEGQPGAGEKKVESLIRVNLWDLAEKVKAGEHLEAGRRYLQQVPQGSPRLTQWGLPPQAQALLACQIVKNAPRHHSLVPEIFYGEPGYGNSLPGTRLASDENPLLMTKQGKVRGQVRLTYPGIFGEFKVTDRALRALMIDRPAYEPVMRLPEALWQSPENGLNAGIAYLERTSQAGTLYSNFDPARARQSPDYIPDLLSTLFHDDFRMSSEPAFVAVKDSKLVDDLKRYGFVPVGTQDGFQVLKIKPEKQRAAHPETWRPGVNGYGLNPRPLF